MNFNSTRKLIAFISSAVATLLCVLGIIFMKNDFFSLLGSIGVFLSIFSYIIGGGFLDAVKAAFNIGKWGWIIMPFPIDIATGIASTLCAILLFLCIPVVFVGKKTLSDR